MVLPCSRGRHALPELYSNTCLKLFDSYLFRTAAWAFYYSKYVEYLDTAWLVLKGKPVNLLQDVPPLWRSLGRVFGHRLQE